MNKLLLILPFFIFGFNSLAQITVDEPGDVIGAPGTNLREAVSAATPGQTINFIPTINTININSPIDIDNGGIIIDGNFNVEINNNSGIIFRTGYSSGGIVILRGLKLSNSATAMELQQNNHEVTFDHVTVENCSSIGVSLASANQKFVAMQSNFINNTNSFGGAAIRSGQSGNVIDLSDCVFSSNTCTGDGAAIYATDVNVTMINCVFDNNNAGASFGPSRGGAIFLNNFSGLYINDCLFENNESDNGAGIYLMNAQSSSDSIVNTTFYQNKASAQGGGIYLATTGVFVDNCTFYLNEANTGAGMYYSAIGGIYLYNSTFHMNTSTSTSGGSLDGACDYVQANNTIFGGNTNGSNNGPDLRGVPTDVNYCLIQTSPASTAGNVGSILNTDPLFDSYDVGLKVVPLNCNSPCINVGNSLNTLDQIGNNRNLFGGYDMGAVEYQYPAMTYSNYNSTNESCFGVCDGSLQVDVNGGDGAYSFLWSAGLNVYTTEDVTTACQGNYNLSITDGQGCSISAGSVLNIGGPLSAVTASVFGSDESCYGALDGSITVSPSGGQFPYNISISGPMNQSSGTISSSHTFSSLIGGSYNIVVTDNLGCTYSVSYTLNAPTQINNSSVISSSHAGGGVSCNGSSDAEITITGSGGSGSLQYSIDNSNFFFSNIFTGISAGSYNCYVRDADGCKVSTSLVITEPTLLNASHTVNQIDCHGNNNGVVTVSINGGTPSYSTNGTAGNLVTFNGLSAGMFNYNVTDLNGCSVSGSQMISEPLALSGSVSAIDELCNGSNDGALSFSVSGGTGIVEFSIDGGINYSPTNPITGLSPNVYDCWVRDANGCVISLGNIMVNSPSPVVINFVESQFISCNGVCDGEITANPSGGSGSYSYIWSNGSTSQVNTNICAGSYSLSVSDVNGCVAANSYNISEPGALSLSVINQTSPSCSNINDGLIELSATGGAGSYLYSIDGGTFTQSLPTFSSLSNGNYDPYVEDANGCSFGLSPISLFGPSFPTVSAGSDFTGCVNEIFLISGTISNASSSVWSSNSGNLSNANNLTTSYVNSSVGVYNLILTANGNGGCLPVKDTIVASIIPKPNPGTSVNTSLCTDNGPFDLFSLLTGHDPGGVWSITAGTGSLVGSIFTPPALNGNTSFKYVVDNGFCKDSVSLNITLNLPPTINPGNNFTICESGTETLVESVSNYVGLTWSTDGSGSFSPSNSSLNPTFIPSGFGSETLTLTVTGAGACSNSSASIVATINQQFSAGTGSNSNVCEDAGTIDLNTLLTGADAGGIWSDDNATGQLTGSNFSIGGVAPSATYSFTYSTSSTPPCTNSSTTVLVTVSPLPNSGTGSNITLCESQTSFDLNSLLSAFDPTGSWEDNSGNPISNIINPNIEGPGSYTYTYIVNATAPCTNTATTSVVVTIDSQPNAGIDISSNHCTDETSIDLTALLSGATTGGAFTHFYGTGSLSVSDFDASVSSGLDSIYYKLVSGVCVDSSFIELTVGQTPSFTLNSNNPSACGASDGDITILGLNSSQSYNVSINSGTPVSFNSDAGGNILISAISAGAYSVTVIDPASACSYTHPAGISLSDPSAPSFTIGNIVHPTTCGGTDGSLELIWSNPPGGNYDLSIDVNGSPVNFGTLNLVNPSLVNGLPQGTYSNFIVDYNGCQGSDGTLITLNDPVSPGSASINLNNISCNGLSDGNISFVSVGNLYSIDNGNTSQSNQNFNGLSAGNYHVTYQHPTTLCWSVVDTVLITEPTPILVTVTDTAISCNGANDGQIHFSNISGGTNPYFITFDNSNFLNIGANTSYDSLNVASSVSGYQVIVKDANGCNSQITFVAMTDPLPIQTDVFVNDLCNFNDTAYIEFLNPSGGTGIGTYDFSIDNGNTWQALSFFGSNITPGSYQISMQDDNGCRFDTTVNVQNNIPNQPIVNASSLYCENQPAVASATGIGSIAWVDINGNIIGTGSTITIPNSVNNGDFIGAIDIVGGCSSAPAVFTFNIDINTLNVSPDEIICPGDSAYINANASPANIVWQSNGLGFDTTSHSVWVAPTNTMYFVAVHNSGACVYSDSVLITVDANNNCTPLPSDLTSNAFSPNGDGVNDLWIIDDVINYPQNVVSVFNRWGDKILEFNNYDNNNVVWDGKSSDGSELPTGTYFYVIEYTDIDQVFNGWIQITK